ncbi:tRNA (guanosine(37)-N1)-methyltransferase TrmD [Catelliglobosispora koreensis]|uniref:tRNA (guanosine(37)-N1)-methyltransferase TrmD n=1 Tax=Catelliglobosispora koreensis TaxID=129052 RepID=UPI000381D217|nr:tRNA (guanosine(37)-N1)-methyltransferase TrmD [Catelliglobosispora koreensis]
MRIDIVSIFPEYFAPLDLSLIGKARSSQVDLAVHDLRQWTFDVHRTVDDTPYGGGPGMVMKPEPWGLALDALNSPSAQIIVPSPAGKPFTQEMAASLVPADHLIFACGRYEGIDQRVIEHYGATEVSLGDYVLFGGEVAVLVMLEAIIRLIPGVLGNASSLDEESHANGLLESPVYTKPPSWRELDVPEILRSGDHGKIARWRRDQALLRTASLRPDLLEKVWPTLDKRDLALLAEAGFASPGADVAE